MFDCHVNPQIGFRLVLVEFAEESVEGQLLSQTSYLGNRINLAEEDLVGDHPDSQSNKIQAILHIENGKTP